MRLHQSLGLQQPTISETILYLHTRQDKQHPNAASGITNSIPMYRTEISLFCGLCSTASLLRLYTSFLTGPHLNPSHITHSTPASHTSSKMLSPHLVLLALTVPPSPGSDSAMFLTITPELIPPHLVLSLHSFLLLHPVWANNSFAEMESFAGRTVSFLLPPLCLGPQHSSGDQCRNIKASSLVPKYSILNAT